MKNPLIEIGYDKNGELDFGILATVQELTLEQMNELRQMIIVAIYVAEDIWRRERERKNPSSQVKTK